MALTGFLSHAAYEPGVGRNAIVDPGRDLPLGIGWPAAPAWLYGLTQGLHVNVGLATVPLLLAKLWSVIPRLFAWPPVASPAQAIERASIALLVASAVFEFATGIINAQNYYAFDFSFVVAHYYGAVVFVASLAVHIVVKLPVMVRAYRERGLPLRDDLAAPSRRSRRPAPRPRSPAAGCSASSARARRCSCSPTSARRSAARCAGSRCSPRGAATRGPGPTASRSTRPPRARASRPAMTGDGYRLVLRAGERELRLTRADLLAMEQRTEELPIACVEGWTTTQRWTGVPLASLAERGRRRRRGRAARRVAAAPAARSGRRR